MFYSSAAPGRHKIISKLSIMFNTTLAWPLITIHYRYAILFMIMIFWKKNHKNFNQWEWEMKILVFRLGFPDMGWSILIWKWNKDWVIDLNLKFWLPSRVSTLNTNFTSHQFNIISKSHSPENESGFSKRKFTSAKKETPKKFAENRKWDYQK